MTPEDRIARAERAKAAWDEFVGPALLTVKAEYGNRLLDTAEKKPWRWFRIIMLAFAVKVCRRVEGRLQAVIADGRDAEATLKRQRQIDKISDHKRDVLGV